MTDTNESLRGLGSTGLLIAALENMHAVATSPRASGSMRRLYIDEAAAALEQLAAALRAGGPVPDVALAASASGAAPPTLSSAVDSIGRGYAERLLETPREDWSSIGTDLLPRSLQPALETIADARAALASLPSDLDMFAVRRSVVIDEKREPR